MFRLQGFPVYCVNERRKDNLMFFKNEYFPRRQVYDVISPKIY